MKERLILAASLFALAAAIASLGIPARAGESSSLGMVCAATSVIGGLTPAKFAGNVEKWGNERLAEGRHEFFSPNEGTVCAW